MLLLPRLLAVLPARAARRALVPARTRLGAVRAYAALLDPAHSVDFELPRMPKDAIEVVPEMVPGGFEYHWHVRPRDQRPPVTPVRPHSPHGTTPFAPLDPAASRTSPTVAAPGAGAENREVPHAAGVGHSVFDARLIWAARRVFEQAAPRSLPDLKQLLTHFESRAGLQLNFELPMEPTPAQDRRAPLTSPQTPIQELRAAWDDGSLLVVYVSGHLDDTSAVAESNLRLSVCSGFAIAGEEHMPDAGPLMVTCAHTLQNAFRVPLARRGTPAAQAGFMPLSVAFAISRHGAIYPIRKLVSSLPDSDVILYQLDPSALGASDGKAAPLRTLPVSPYPAVVGTELAVASFTGWGGESAPAIPSAGEETDEDAASPSRKSELRRRNAAARSRWGRAEVIKYRDECGAEAHTGTYDSLSQMEFKVLPHSPHNPPLWQARPLPATSASPDEGALAASTGGLGASDKVRKRPMPDFPPPGSSGGPVVDVATGAVVGIVRSTKYGFFAGRHGDAVPAEQLFNCASRHAIDLEDLSRRAGGRQRWRGERPS